MKIKEAIKELRAKSKKRNFLQRLDLIINLKEFDPNKPENKFDEIFKLPHGTGKPTRITIFHSENIKVDNYRVIDQNHIEKLEKNKKELKNIIKNTDFFLAEPKLMPIVGKYLGKYLAPKGLMPKPIIGDVNTIIKSMEGSIRLSIKKHPIIQTVVGIENMKDEEIEDNINAIIEFLRVKLPKGKNNIKNIYLKFTMSTPVKIEV